MNEWKAPRGAKAAGEFVEDRRCGPCKQSAYGKFRSPRVLKSSDYFNSRITARSGPGGRGPPASGRLDDWQTVDARIITQTKEARWSPPLVNAPPSAADGLAFAEGDAALGQVVRRELDADLVARDDADEVLPHTAGDVSGDLMAPLDLDAEPRIRERLSDDPFNLQSFFFLFRHIKR